VLVYDFDNIVLGFGIDLEAQVLVNVTGSTRGMTKVRLPSQDTDRPQAETR